MTLLPGIDPFPQDPAARVRASSAWYTPPEAARVLAGMCTSSRLRLPQGKPWRILEPSAGRGALLQALIDEQSPCAPTIVDAIDLDPRTAEHLNQQCWPLDVRVECADYLTRPPPAEPYDLALLNPPYEGGLDSAFLSKAMDESLRVVALVRLALLESQRSYERVWSRLGGSPLWRLLELRPFVLRPSFLPGGEEKAGAGKSAFVAIKLSRVSCDPRETTVEWVR